MRLNDIKTVVTRGFHKGVFNVKKHSPEILVVGGVVGVVTSAVMACKATTKLNAILEEAKASKETIIEYSKTEEGTAKYTEEECAKAVGLVTVKTGLEVAKLYAPSVVLGGLSIACIFAGNNIIRQRYASLAAAYAAVDKGFSDYRGRVIDRFGKEIDKELKYNLKTKEVVEEVVNEDGSVSEVVTNKDVMSAETSSDLASFSPYSRFFDDGCKGWTKSPDLNYTFLLQTQKFANRKLKDRGYLFLNEVYDMLGIPHTMKYHTIGWLYQGEGEGHVDFGLTDIHREKTRDFVNGYENVILLDFNVDGDIYSSI